jgi:glycosyltransferase involved in cell wall biosynthesis
MAEVSVVIPTLNEAANLAELLPQLRSQTLAPREVVVADHHSQDHTARIASQWGARLVEGGRPAQARNAGAACCRGQWLFFLDADTRLPDELFLEMACQDLARQDLAAAVSDVGPHYRPQDKGHDRAWLRAWDGLLMGAQNRGQRAWLRLGFPVGTAQFMAVRRDVFQDLGGFAAAAEPFEDSELLLRVHRRLPPAAKGRSSVGVLGKSIHVLVSMRRFDVMGRFWFPLRLSLRATLLRYLLRRELPLPNYWDVNQRGLYGPTGSAAASGLPGDKAPPAC